MARENEIPTSPRVRSDRRRRHAHDPTISISLTLPVSLANAVDDAAVARRWARNAVIRAAIEQWLAEEPISVDAPPLQT